MGVSVPMHVVDALSVVDGPLEDADAEGEELTVTEREGEAEGLGLAVETVNVACVTRGEAEAVPDAEQVEADRVGVPVWDREWAVGVEERDVLREREGLIDPVGLLLKPEGLTLRVREEHEGLGEREWDEVRGEAVGVGVGELGV